MRPLVRDDCAAAVSLIRRAFAGLPVDPPPSAGRVTAADVAEHLAGGGGGVVLDEAQGELRGCLLWAGSAGELQISRLAVDPAYRRRGLARAMLSAAEGEALRRSLAVLRLSARLGLPGNRLLFERCGFVETGRTAHPGFTEPTSVTFEKIVMNPATLLA